MSLAGSNIKPKSKTSPARTGATTPSTKPRKTKSAPESATPLEPITATETTEPVSGGSPPEPVQLFFNNICYTYSLLESTPNRDALSIEIAFRVCLDYLVPVQPTAEPDLPRMTAAPGTMTWIEGPRLEGTIQVALSLPAGGTSEIAASRSSFPLTRREPEQRLPAPIVFGREANAELRKLIWILDTFQGLRNGYDHEISHVHDILRTCIDDLRLVVAREVGPILNRFQGMEVKSLEEKREICCETNALLDDVGLRVRCPKTHLPARLITRTGKGAPLGQFQFEVKGFKTCTSSSRTFPPIRLTLAPRDLRYERGKINMGKRAKTKAPKKPRST